MKKERKYILPEISIPYLTNEISMHEGYDTETNTFLFTDQKVNIPTEISYRKNHYVPSEASKVIYVNLDDDIKNKISWRMLDDIWEYHQIFRETHDYLFSIDMEHELSYILSKCGDVITMPDFEQILEKEDIYTRLLELADSE